MVSPWTGISGATWLNAVAGVGTTSDAAATTGVNILKVGVGMSLRAMEGYAVAVHGYNGDVIGCGVLTSKSYMYRTEASNKSSGAKSLNFLGLSLMMTTLLLLLKWN